MLKNKIDWKDTTDSTKSSTKKDHLEADEQGQWPDPSIRSTEGLLKWMEKHGSAYGGLILKYPRIPGELTEEQIKERDVKEKAKNEL